MNIIAGLLFQLWQKYIEILKFASFEINKTLIDKHNEILKKKYSIKKKKFLEILYSFEQSLIKETIKVPELSAFKKNNIGKIHKEMASELRKKVSYNYKKSMIVEEEYINMKPISHPILFEELYLKEIKVKLKYFLTYVYFRKIKCGYHQNQWYTSFQSKNN